MSYIYETGGKGSGIFSDTPVNEITGEQEWSCRYSVDSISSALPWFAKYFGAYVDEDFSWESSDLWKTEQGRALLQQRIENPPADLIERIHKRIQQEPEFVKCKCGHTVPRALVMSASLGSSCPRCYDRMSS